MLESVHTSIPIVLVVLFAAIGVLIAVSVGLTVIHHRKITPATGIVAVTILIGGVALATQVFP